MYVYSRCHGGLYVKCLLPFSLSRRKKSKFLIVENKAGSQNTGDDMTMRTASRKRLKKKVK